MIKEQIIKWLIPFICGGIVSFGGTMLSNIKKLKKKDKAIELGLQCLLRAEIIRSYEKCKDRGFCPLYSKEALKREYDSYHQLGGNDVATDLYKQIMALPTEFKGELEHEKRSV